MNSEEKREYNRLRQAERKDFLEDAAKAFEAVDTNKSNKEKEIFNSLTTPRKIKLGFKKESWFLAGTLLLAIGWCIEKFGVVKNDLAIAAFNTDRQTSQAYYINTRQLYFEQQILDNMVLKPYMPRGGIDAPNYRIDKINSQAFQIWALINMAYGKDSAKAADDYTVRIARSVFDIASSPIADSVKLGQYDSLINVANNRLEQMASYPHIGVKRINSLRKDNSCYKILVILLVIVGTFLLTVQKVIRFMKDKKNFTPLL